MIYEKPKAGSTADFADFRRSDQFRILCFNLRESAKSAVTLIQEFDKESPCAI